MKNKNYIKRYPFASITSYDVPRVEGLNRFGEAEHGTTAIAR